MDKNSFWINTKDIMENGYDIGFKLYSTPHLIWLAVILATVVIATVKYKKCNFKTWAKVCKRIAITLLIMEICKDSILIITHRFNEGYLPLHLCGLAIFGILADAFLGKNKVTGQMIAYGFMPGAVSALLFCNWTEYPLFSFMSIFSFVFHGIIVCYMIMRYAGGEIKPSYRGLWYTIGIIGVALVPIYFFNKTFGTNYMFLNEASEGSPLTFIWDIFGTRFGEIGYLVGFALLAITAFHVLYLIYRVMNRVVK